jgi:hypothetical protein
MYGWLLKNYRRWKTRCKSNKMHSGCLPTAYLAQHYLAEMRAKYEPCKVCGEWTCRWATERPKEHFEFYFNKNMERLNSLIGGESWLIYSRYRR